MILKKLKERWGITSNFQIVIIFIVFGITGTVSAYISGPLTDFIIGENDIHWLIKLLIRILVLTPIYQVLLLLFGYIFFQYRFSENHSCFANIWFLGCFWKRGDTGSITCWLYCLGCHNKHHRKGWAIFCASGGDS